MSYKVVKYARTEQGEAREEVATFDNIQRADDYARTMTNMEPLNQPVVGRQVPVWYKVEEAPMQVKETLIQVYRLTKGPLSKGLMIVTQDLRPVLPAKSGKISVSLEEMGDYGESLSKELSFNAEDGRIYGLSRWYKVRGAKPGDYISVRVVEPFKSYAFSVIRPSRPEPESRLGTPVVEGVTRTIPELIEQAIRETSGRARLKEIYPIVNKLRPKTTEPVIRGVLYQSVKQGRFAKNPDGTYSLGVGSPSHVSTPSRFPIGAIVGGKLFAPIELAEEDLEKFVVQNSRLVFGSGGLFIPKKKLVGSHIKKVTDGLLLDLNEEPTFSIVEIELGKHDPEDHVQNQVLGFLRALKDEKSLRSLVRVVYEYVEKSGEVGDWYGSYFVPGFADANSEQYAFIESILHGKCGVIIVIDNVTPQLREVVSSLSETRPVKVIEFKTFRKDRELVHTFSQPDLSQSD